jgi:hypothetical protein
MLTVSNCCRLQEALFNIFSVRFNLKETNCSSAMVGYYIPPIVMVFE